MGLKKKYIFNGFEILYNSFGQLYIKKRFLINSTRNFYRYILGGS